MLELLQVIHPWVGYLASLVVLVVALRGFGWAKDAREFVPGPYALGTVAIDITVLIGVLVYVLGGYWDARPEIAYLHPVLAFASLGLGHALLGRARKQQMAVDAHRTAARGLLLALVVLLAAIGVASAPAFL